MEELDKLKGEIIKCGISESEYANSFELLRIIVETVPETEYSQFLEEAKKISPHKKDAPLFALSLALDKAPIWSRDLRLKRQKVVRVFSDREVKEFLKHPV
jgi:predicted nucleic acid-binding protein